LPGNSGAIRATSAEVAGEPVSTRWRRPSLGAESGEELTKPSGRYRDLHGRRVRGGRHSRQAFVDQRVPARPVCRRRVLVLKTTVSNEVDDTAPATSQRFLPSPSDPRRATIQ